MKTRKKYVFRVVAVYAGITYTCPDIMRIGGVKRAGAYWRIHDYNKVKIDGGKLLRNRKEEAKIQKRIEEELIRREAAKKAALYDFDVQTRNEDRLYR